MHKYTGVGQRECVMRIRFESERVRRRAQRWGRSRMCRSTLIAIIGMVGISLVGARAEAQFSGSIHGGQSSTTTTYQDGRVESRSQGRSVNASFGRGAHSERDSGRDGGRVALTAGGRSPYGRLNYGRG